jgi:RNA polymerase sigma-70 factor (ECF subfamily)
MSSGFALPFDPDHLAALRRGERAALGRAYDCYAAPVHGLALRVLGHPDDAADVVQEVFLKLPRAVRRYRGEAPFGLWLRRLAANATVDQLRQRRRLVALDEARAELAGEAGVPASLAEAQGLLDRLSPSARLVLLLHAVEGYTHTEMAALFGQSPSWSKSVLARALQRLREHLAAPPNQDLPHDRPLRSK